MATRKSTRKKLGDGLPTGRKIGTELIKVYVKSDVAYEQVRKEFVPTQHKAGSLGQGIFKYEGSFFDNGNIFVGFCSSLKAGIIQFTGEDASKNYQNFQNTYLTKVEPSVLSTFGLGTTVSSVISLNEIYNEADVLAKFEKMMGQQEKKFPKISVTKDGLQIGSKSTDNFIVLVPLSSSDGVVTKFQLVAKITKDSSIFDSFLANKDSKFEDILALSLIQFISKLTLVGSLVDVKTALIENHKIGQIQEKKATAVLSKDGKTVQRSLSAVRNKLASPSSAEETKQLLFQWFSVIEPLLKDDEKLKKSISNLNKSSAQPPPPPAKQEEEAVDASSSDSLHKVMSDDTTSPAGDTTSPAADRRRKR